MLGAKGGAHMAFDYKREYKEFYLPPQKPQLICVPEMRFAAVRGQGDPNEEGGAYQRALSALYALCYTLKMSKLGDHRIEGYFDYVVPPLEGLWSVSYTHLDVYKRQLHAYAVGRAADGERLAHRTVAAGADHALKRLPTLAGNFDDLHEHAHGITDAELGNVSPELGALDGTDDLIHSWGLLPLQGVHNRLAAADRPMSQSRLYHTSPPLTSKRHVCLLYTSRCV